MMPVIVYNVVFSFVHIVDTSRVPSSLGSSAQLRQQIRLSFVPKSDAVVRYFCIIRKARYATLVVNSIDRA